MSRSVVVEAGRLRYAQSISVGCHLLQGDEPVSAGGSDAGPNPYELLLAALGTCTSITVCMYADRKQWPLEGVHIELSYARVHAEDCAACDLIVTDADGPPRTERRQGQEDEVAMTARLKNICTSRS